jgi:WD40 repeat protein
MAAAATRKKLVHFLRADPAAFASSSAAASSSATSSPRSFSSNDSSVSDDDNNSYSSSSPSSFPASASSSPSRSSPPKSPWAATTHLPGLGGGDSSLDPAATGLVASLVKEDGKIYSLAAAGDVLYTGTDSENVRVWRDRRELAGLRAGSGLVKAIVVAADGRIFTGHQDGKVRVWRAAGAGGAHRRVGSLPALGDYLVSSVNPSSYVVGRRQGGGGRRRRAVWLRHSDAVSCLSLDEGAGLLYSGSWDRTFKVWRVSDSRCLESVPAHDDAVNTVAAAGFGGLVLTGSADGTVKVWRREEAAGGERTRHVLVRVLREGDGAVTAVAACPEARAVYVGSSDGLVTCWQWGAEDGGGGEPRMVGVLAGHRMGVMCLAVSGRVVVSGSADRTLCVWRRDGDDGGVYRHVRLAVLAGHTGPVKCVAVAADIEDCYNVDGERRFVVYSGSLDGSVKVWRLSEDRPLEEPKPTVPLMPVLMESEAWTTPALPSPAWAPPELKRVAAA